MNEKGICCRVSLSVLGIVCRSLCLLLSFYHFLDYMSHSFHSSFLPSFLLSLILVFHLLLLSIHRPLILPYVYPSTLNLSFRILSIFRPFYFYATIAALNTSAHIALSLLGGKEIFLYLILLKQCDHLLYYSFFDFLILNNRI